MMNTVRPVESKGFPMRHAVRFAAVAALALTAACGGSSKSPGSTAGGTSPKAARPVDAVALVTQAQSKTIAKGSSRFTSATTSTSGFRVNATGAFDYRTGNGMISQTVATGGRNTQQQIRLVNGIAYVSLPALTTGKFFKIDLRSLLGRGGAGGALDQTAQLRLLLGAAKSLHPVDAETVRGVPTTHFAGTLDVTKALSSIKDPKLKQGLRGLTSGLHLPKELPVDVWIDKEGLCRRVRESYALTAQKIGSTTIPASTATTTNEYFDFGTPVHVAAPPSSAVVG